MNRRPAPAEIIQGLSTKSGKIRALTQAGYSRTEISQELGIVYQFVRNVLTAPKIASVRQPQAEVAQDPLTIGAAPPPSRETTSPDVILCAGFQALGEWTLVTGGAIRLDAQAPSEPGVFVLDDAVAYVGLTNNGLRVRLDQYRRGYERQRTNARVRELIAQALAHGRKVRVLIATPPPHGWNGLPVNTAAGLEAGLIQMIRPAWNILGAA